MKKYLIVIIILFSVFLFFKNTYKEEVKEKIQIKDEKKEKKAIFISYIELQKYIGKKDSKTSKKNIEKRIM